MFIMLNELAMQSPKNTPVLLQLQGKQYGTATFSLGSQKKKKARKI